MVLDWEALHSHLLNDLRSRTVQREFLCLHQAEPLLGRFEAPSAIAEFLASPENDTGQKNEIVRRLILLARAGRRWATSTLWLGLWPGLSQLFVERLALLPRAADRLISMIGVALSTSTARLDLQRSQQPLATLVLNTRRRFDEALRQGRMDLDRLDDVSQGLQKHGGLLTTPEVTPSAFGMALAGSAQDGLATIRHWLDEHVERDADLIVATVLEGRTFVELSADLGVPPKTLRSRYQRALRVLRKKINKSQFRVKPFFQAPAYSK